MLRRYRGSGIQFWIGAPPETPCRRPTGPIRYTVATIQMGVEHFYRELASPPDLQQWIDCLWVREAAIGEGQDQSPHTHLVLPDGCIDILFELAGPHGGTSFVVGMMTESLHVRRTGRMSIIAIRFRPSGAARFFREPLANLTDARVALADLWRGSGSIAERLAE